MKHTVRLSILLGAAMVATAGAASAEGTSLPQMDTSWFPNQLFWLAVSFIALYLVVSKMVSPKVGGMLAARDATIADAIAKAESFKAHADQTRGSAEAGAQNARAQAAEITARVQEEAAKAHADAMAKLNASLEAEAAKADAALKKAVAAATGDLDAASTDLARAIAEKLLGKEVDEASIKAARKAA